jgi:hypothetical protein
MITNRCCAPAAATVMLVLLQIIPLIALTIKVKQPPGSSIVLAK